MFLLSAELIFPPIEQAHDDGLLCIGGDLSFDRLLLAYQKGIFPWYSDDDPILWYSPDPRFVLFPEKIKVSKSMKQVLNKGELIFKINHSFKDVIHNCKIQKRKGQDGTWITNEMENAYTKLHELGIAHSFECYVNEALVGGLYGVLLDRVFCGESMFSLQPNTSKFVLIQLCKYLQEKNIAIIDCQIYTPHLESLGAEMISRKDFQRYL
jgi:leucyl/phenylalanyl-tRNA---protein transferase